MTEPSFVGLWARRGLFLLAAGVLILAGLVPLGGASRPVPPPEALLALTLAWVARRPAEVPALSVAVVFVIADLLFQRPPGLHAFLVLAAAEWLRARPARTTGLPAEWARAGAAILAVGLAEQALLALTLAAGPPFGPAMARAALTAAAYPVAALSLSVILGVRNPRPHVAKEAA